MDFIAVNHEDYDQTPILVRGVKDTDHAYKLLAETTYQTREAKEPDHLTIHLDVMLYRLPAGTKTEPSAVLLVEEKLEVL